MVSLLSSEVMKQATKAVAAVIVTTCCGVTAAQKPAHGELERVIAITVQEEVRANHIEKRKDVCLAIDNRSEVDERLVLSELKRRHLMIRSDDWCTRGPRGLTIVIISPPKEISAGTYELIVDIDDSGPITRGEHFAELIRRRKYTVRSTPTSGPEIMRYEKTCCPDDKNEQGRE